MQITVDVITTRRDIYNALCESEDNQSIIGISAGELGPGLYMTMVKEIIDHGDDMLIVLNSYDRTGYFLEKNKIALSDINGVIPFKAVFTNPFLKGLAESQNDEAGQARSADYLF